MGCLAMYGLNQSPTRKWINLKFAEHAEWLQYTVLICAPYTIRTYN